MPRWQVLVNRAGAMCSTWSGRVGRCRRRRGVALNLRDRRYSEPGCTVSALGLRAAVRPPPPAASREPLLQPGSRASRRHRASTQGARSTVRVGGRRKALAAGRCGGDIRRMRRWSQGTRRRRESRAVTRMSSGRSNITVGNRRRSKRSSTAATSKARGFDLSAGCGSSGQRGHDHRPRSSGRPALPPNLRSTPHRWLRSDSPNALLGPYVPSLPALARNRAIAANCMK